LHEDLNAVTKKPYIEMIDKPDRPDDEIAKEFWDNHIARNKSIIVDLMYGQVKSTVTCLTC
jgi:ubiquitin carboxyl-terminal hydrolase 4/11/15